MKRVPLLSLLALLLFAPAGCSKKENEPPLTAAQKVSLGLGGDSGGTDEVSAINALRSIAVAQSTYSASNQGYACSLSALSSFIDPVLASGSKSGYSFDVSCAGDSPATRYRASATPGIPGKRAFCVDETGSMKYSANGSAESCFSGNNLVQ
jgi:hypothetical protein